MKDHRYKIHPTENNISRLREEPKYLRTQYQVQNGTQVRKTPKIIRDGNNELIVKNYPKIKQPTIQQPNVKPPNCPSCKRSIWLEFDNGYCCKNCEYIIIKQKHLIDNKVRRQDYYFATRLNYADKKIREFWMNMVNTTYNTTEDMNNKLQSLKSKTNSKFYKNISNYYDGMSFKNFKFQQYPFSKNVEGIIKTYHEVSLLMKFLQIKPQIKNMNIKS